MAILLVGPPLDVGQHLIARLIAQDDDVRVVEDDSTKAEVWKQLGAHVALGEWDEDLVERAAQNVRTLVLFDYSPGLEPWLLEQLVTGARLARVTRVVLCTKQSGWGEEPVLKRSGLQYVVLETGNRQTTLFRRARGTDPSSVALAIDAADDLADEIRAVVNLTKPKGWQRLKLTPPPD